MSESTGGSHPPWLMRQSSLRPDWSRTTLGGPPYEQLARHAWHLSLHGLDGEESSVAFLVRLAKGSTIALTGAMRCLKARSERPDDVVEAAERLLRRARGVTCLPRPAVIRPHWSEADHPA